ncbi:hypothetical protein AAZX31_08G255700 [Glycine max]|nr:hypothetical protein GLYMA_08G261450v4 [Glycine max]KAH1053151.1 hypothetical protein GYH30_022447 [Glycine max]
MSSWFYLEVVIGALLKLGFGYACVCCMLLWLVLNSAVSMSLRSKRTCYGILVCYGGFQIKKFSAFFLLWRVDLT